jgi:alkylation response protein AidB-like acyl-CoA dehydrogenase
MDRFELRYTDYSLSSDQEAVRDAFGEFFANECPTERVRAAEPLGYDEKLWRMLADLGAASMGLPEARRLVPAAFAYAAQVATHGATTSAHMQGGLGFTIEADASLYFLRAKGWSLLAGDPAEDVIAVADALIAGSGW